MKNCAYCGKENDDNALECCECMTEFSNSAEESAGLTPLKPRFARLELEFLTPTPQDMEKDFVTLLRCRTLLDADMIVAELESAGIFAFIPDEYLMQNIGWNVNTFGFVRVQVAPKDFEAAKAYFLISDLPV